MRKKILFFAIFAMFTMTLMSFVRTIQATWVSTCGVKHITTFTGDWSTADMALYIGEINAGECGNYPKSVTFN